jgi:hypothetical protein
VARAPAFAHAIDACRTNIVPVFEALRARTRIRRAFSDRNLTRWC